MPTRAYCAYFVGRSEKHLPRSLYTDELDAACVDSLSISPRLSALGAETVTCSLNSERNRAQAEHLLRLPVLRVLKNLDFSFDAYTENGDERVLENSLIDAVASHALEGVKLCDANIEANLDAFVDACVRLRLRRLQLVDASAGDEFLAPLCRLLEQDKFLHSFRLTLTQAVPMTNDPFVYWGGVSVPRFCIAVAASRLTQLELSGSGLNPFDDTDDALSLLAACTGHPTLQLLNLSCSRVQEEQRAPMGLALAALVAAPSALEELDLGSCELYDEGSRPLFGSLAANTRLQTLNLQECHISEACVRDSLLPALQANHSLRKLSILDKPPSTWDADWAEHIGPINDQGMLLSDVAK